AEPAEEGDDDEDPADEQRVEPVAVGDAGGDAAGPAVLGAPDTEAADRVEEAAGRWGRGRGRGVRSTLAVHRTSKPRTPSSPVSGTPRTRPRLHPGPGQGRPWTCAGGLPERARDV